MSKKITIEEAKVFHENYDYMWNKLNTSHHYVKNDPGRAPHIAYNDFLPAYSICSQCKDKNYIPTEAIVHKIVRFYNANMTPQIDSYIFCHELLEKTDVDRKPSHNVLNPHLMGLYRCYYPSPSVPGSFNGGLLCLYSIRKATKVIMVSGIRSDETLRDPMLAALFKGIEETKDNQKTCDIKIPRDSDFKKYFDNKSIDEQSYYYYEGTADVTEKSLLVTLRGVGKDHRKLVLTLDLNSFQCFDREYLGGLAFVMTTRDGPFSARFYKMGLAKTKSTKLLSLNSPELPELLNITDEMSTHRLENAADSKWFEHIRSKR